MPRDQKRIVRALEVYFATGQPLTAHFAATRSLIADCDVTAIALRLPADVTAARVARRVEAQFARGVVDEVRALLARGVPPHARPFGGLVYRQIIEMLRGVRDEPSTRALIVAGEPPLRATPVDLVPQRAYSYLVRRPRRGVGCTRARRSRAHGSHHLDAESTAAAPFPEETARDDARS